MVLKFDFGQVLKIIFLTYGSLFVMSAVGISGIILGIAQNILPDMATGSIQGIAFPPVAGLVATVLLAFIGTLLAVAISEGMENQKLWGMFIGLAVLSAVLWIVLPQYLPKVIQPAAGAAQAVFTSVAPQSVVWPW